MSSGIFGEGAALENGTGTERLALAWQRLTAYLAAIWACRYFWLSLVGLDLRTRYRRSLLGIGWSLLHPLAMSTVICIVWSNLWGFDIWTFGPSVISGLTFWQYVTGCVNGGCGTFLRGEAYIRQCPIPMAVYPLRIMLGAAFHYVMGLLVVLAVTWTFQGLGNLPGLPLLVPGFVVLMIFGWSVAVLTGVANLYFPDTGHMTVIILQILFYATPIIYDPGRLRRAGMGWLLDCNPLAALLEMMREPVLSAQLPPTLTLTVALTTVMVAFIAAVIVLIRFQDRIIFQL